MKLLALIGDPVSHSHSPILHNYAIKALGFDALYIAIKAIECELGPSLLEFKPKAANITYPLKKEILKYCHSLDIHAANIKAVNTIVKLDEGYKGYNTDWQGLIKSLENHKIKKALILGSGASAACASYAFKSLDISFLIASRSKEDLGYIKYENLKDFSYDLVLNTTPSGLIGDFYPCKKELLIKLFQNSKLVMDINYKSNTPFLELAKSQAKAYQDGSSMLMWQAFYAFKLFFDLDDSFDIKIQKSMEEALERLKN